MNRRAAQQIFIELNKWINLGRSKGGPGPEIHFFSLSANSTECLPCAGLRALHCGHHFTVPSVPGSGGGLVNALACFHGPRHFSAFLHSCAPHTLPHRLSLFPTVGTAWCEKASLLKLWLAPSPTSQGIPEYFPWPLVPVVQEALGHCISPHLFSACLPHLSAIHPHLSAVYTLKGYGAGKNGQGPAGS